MKIVEMIWTRNPFPPITGEAERLSLTGADEFLVGEIHRQLCRLSPINELATHSSTLAQLSPADVDEVVTAIIHPAVQSGDIRGIMAMRAPLPAPEPAISEVKTAPEGVRAMTSMDHRLGAWK